MTLGSPASEEGSFGVVKAGRARSSKVSLSAEQVNVSWHLGGLAFPFTNLRVLSVFLYSFELPRWL